jgi:integrase
MPIFLKDRKTNPWRAKVKRKGFKEEYAYFPTKDEANEWEEMRSKTLRRKAKGLAPDIADLGKITIGDMVKHYLKEEIAYKAGGKIEAYSMQSFLDWKDMKTRPLIAFTRPDAIEYRNYLEREHVFEQKPYLRNGKLVHANRKPKGLKPGSVRRKIATLGDMWTIAARDWRGYEALRELGNPWSAVSSTKKPRKRTRRLDDLPSRKNELDRLLEASKGCRGINKIYMRLAINLAVQTGMRLQEILLLTPNDFDRNASTITIRKSKTDHKSDDDGRVIAVPFVANIYLIQAMMALALSVHPHLKGFKGTHYKWRAENRLFQISRSAFEQAWTTLLERAGINSKEQDAALGIKESQCGLEFRDLRREAGSRFDEAGLTKMEHDLMLGHANGSMAGVYIAPHLKKIEGKLDDYWVKNTDLLDPITKEAFDKQLDFKDIMAISILEMLGCDKLKDITGPGFEIKRDGTVINKETKEVVPLHEAISNVIPLFRKNA